jgi:rare lipoprotein A
MGTSMSMTLTRSALMVGLVLMLGGCGSAPKTTDRNPFASDQERLPRALPALEVMPKAEPKSRYGNMASYQVLGRRYYTKASSRGHIERGHASWYGKKFHGRKTSSGERYDMHQMTAAHKTLPLPSYVLVTNLENGRKAVVRVNDRGPFAHGRVIDLSYAAAKRLEMVQQGTALVEVRSVDPRDHGKDGSELLRLALADVGSQPRPTARPAIASSAAAELKTEPAPFFLQVGAFGERRNAERLQSQLTSRVEQPVLIRSAAGAGASSVYKVQVGPLRSPTDAAALGRQLAALGIDQPVVVR